MAAWFVLFTKCNLVHEMKDDKMDGSSSRNGGKANCSAHLHSEDSHRLEHRPNIHMACGKWRGLAHSNELSVPYYGGDFLCRRRRTHVGQPCSGKVRWRCYRLHDVPMVCHLPHCLCRSLCSAPRSTKQSVITFIAVFISYVRKDTSHDDGNVRCYVITSVYGVFCADVGNSDSTASKGRRILEQ